MGNKKLKILRDFAIELAIYALLVVGYFLLVLRTLGEYLADIFSSKTVLYAFLALALILAQAVLLGSVTGFLVRRLGLQRLE